MRNILTEQNKLKINNDLCNFEKVSSQTINLNDVDKHISKFKFNHFRCLKRLILTIKNAYPKYNHYWESEAENLYNESTIGDEDELIQEQVFLNARDISMIEFDIPTFPWHNNSLENFKSLDRELQSTLDIFRLCNSDKSATKLMRKYRKVYFAYYRNPIRVTMSDNGYELLRDGRHRLWVAQLNNSVIPVWVVTYKNPRSISLKEYKEKIAYGDWRFSRM